MKLEDMSDDQLEIKLHEFLADDCRDNVVPSYCTDWNATMPLAVEYGVSPLISDDNFNHASTDPYETYEPQGMGARDGFFSHPIKDKAETLRAIVICLIKVLEEKGGE